MEGLGQQAIRYEKYLHSRFSRFKIAFQFIIPSCHPTQRDIGL